MQYKIVESGLVSDLACIVDAYVQRGWRPCGGVSSYVHDGNTSIARAYNRHCQGIFRETESNDTHE